MIGTIGFLFWSAVILGPGLLAASVAARCLSRDRLKWLPAVAVAGGFLAGGLIGWSFVPVDWTASIWTTIEAAGDSVKYGEMFEHTAERALMWFFYAALIGEVTLGLAALLVITWLPRNSRTS